MRSRTREWSKVAVIVAATALLLSAGGVGYAAAKIDTSQIARRAVTAPKLDRQAVKAGKIRPEAVKSGKLASGAVTAEKLGDLAVNTSKLADLAVAEAKLEETLRPRWAVVSADGTLVRARNAVSSHEAATGIYDVRFDRDVSDCAYVATVGRADDVLGRAGLPVVNREPNEPTGVRVSIIADSGTPEVTIERPFHLQVEC